jgi:hypothetical protein
MMGKFKVHPEVYASCSDSFFNVGIYFYACSIHFVAFILLGPLINLYTLFSCITKAPYLCSNFLFSRFYQQFYSQNFLWAILMFYYFCTFFTDGDVGDYSGLVYTVVLYFLRASVIGVKYGSYGKRNWDRVKT